MLAWLVRGCFAWQQRGLDIPDPIKVAMNQSRQEEDQLLLFLQEHCVMKPEATVQRGPFHEASRKWIEENQLSQGISSICFGKKMKKRFKWGETMDASPIAVLASWLVKPLRQATGRRALDKNAASPQAFAAWKVEGRLPENCT